MSSKVSGEIVEVEEQEQYGAIGTAAAKSSATAVAAATTEPAER